MSLRARSLPAHHREGGPMELVVEDGVVVTMVAMVAQR
jgi:hypothetical protein